MSKAEAKAKTTANPQKPASQRAREARSQSNKAAWRLRDQITVKPAEERRIFVRTCLARGFEPEEIAARIDMTLATFNETFAADLDRAEEFMAAEVQAALFKNAVHANNFNAQSLYLKARDGWRETKVEDGAGRTTIVLNVQGLLGGSVTIEAGALPVAQTLLPPTPQALDLQGADPA